MSETWEEQARAFLLEALAVIESDDFATTVYRVACGEPREVGADLLKGSLTVTKTEIEQTPLSRQQLLDLKLKHTAKSIARQLWQGIALERRAWRFRRIPETFLNAPFPDSFMAAGFEWIPVTSEEQAMHQIRVRQEREKKELTNRGLVDPTPNQT